MHLFPAGVIKHILDMKKWSSNGNNTHSSMFCGTCGDVSDNSTVTVFFHSVTGTNGFWVPQLPSFLSSLGVLVFMVLFF